MFLRLVIQILGFLTMRYTLFVLLFSLIPATLPVMAQQKAPLLAPLNATATTMPNPTRYEEPAPPASLSAAVSDYIWFPPIFRNREARIFPFIPYRFPLQPGSTDTIEWRGIGQIFAPAINHDFFSGSVYNDTSNIYYDTTGGGPGDQDYIDQFLNVGPFTIDSLQIFVFENALAGRGAFSGKVLVMKTAADLSTVDYRNNGFAQLRQDLPVVWEQVLTPEVLDAASPDTVTTIATRIRIPGSANIRFAEGESAVVLYVNDDAPAVGPDAIPPDADVQKITTQLEWRDGEFSDSTLSGPLEAHKSLGVVLYRDQQGTETILSGFRNLTYQGTPGNFDLLMVFWGTVETKAGVNYHVGTRPGSVMLGEATPNPSVDRTRLPFSLITRSYTMLDLYDATGRHLRTLASADLPPGAYSVDIETSDLATGVYLVRMVTDDRVTTRRIMVGH